MIVSSRAGRLSTKEFIQPDLLVFRSLRSIGVQPIGLFFCSGFLALQFFLFLLLLGQVSLTFGEGVIRFGHGRSSKVEGEGGGAQLPWDDMVAASGCAWPSLTAGVGGQ
ncbi:hypothetical protein AO284_35400 [Pseudomonas sp. NZIPFR-PS2]|nr:hypothetical protein AO284_35400 [Pseudomonas sp. NZIPFR-PS2]